MRRLVVCLYLVLSLAGAMATGARAITYETVTVFAASSLKTALDRIALDWAAAGQGVVVPVYGGSGAMAQQILQGAPADIFVSANPEWMDVVEVAGLIDAASRRDLLGNRLVLVGPAGAAPLDIADIVGRLGDGRLAVGQVASVPAGIYARAALEHLGLWDALAPRLIETDTVRAAARLVGLGEAPLGVVFASDTVGDPALAVIAVFPDDSHPAIVYPGAVLAGAPPAATAFLDYLSSPAAQAVFVAQGFVSFVP